MSASAFISVVPAEFVAEAWEHAGPILERSVNRTAGRFILDDVLHSITEDGYLLWVAVRGEDTLGAVVTFFLRYPRKKYLSVQFCAGSELGVWKDLMFDTLKRFAAENGCDGIEAMGRSGWEGVFRDQGYFPLAQVFEFPIRDIEEVV